MCSSSCRQPSIWPKILAAQTLYDSVANWGYASGNTKASPRQVVAAGVNACLQTVGMATMIAAPITMGIEALTEREAICGPLGECFVAGTPVQTVAKGKDGKYHALVKPIEKVRKGELVLARGEKSGKTQVRRVLQTTVRPADCVITVALADAKTHKVVERLTATRQHPFYVKGKGFVPAGGLAVGNAIVTRAGPVLIVQSIKWNRRPQGYKVYNFVVEDDHSYFVGRSGGGVWVHNGPCDGKALALGRATNGSNGWANMQARLMRLGIGPRQIATITNQLEHAEWMESADSTHFNLVDTSPELLADPTRYTGLEWQQLINNPELWAKTTVYNVPPRVFVPPGIRIGQGF